MGKIAAIVAGALVLTILVVGIFCVDIVPTGHTGIMIHYGQVKPEPVESGHLIFHQILADDVAIVNNKQQDVTVNDQVWGETNDATPVYASGITVTYQIPPEKSVWIYMNVSDYSKNLVSESVVASATKAALVELSPKDVTNRAKIEPLLEKKLTEALNDKYGEGVVLVKKVTIQQMDFEQAYNDAIQAKSIASQQAQQAQIANQVAIEKAETERKIASIEADREIEVKRKQTEADAELEKIKAQTAADKMKIAAEAEAERIRITAEAEAEAKKKLAETINDTMLKYELVQRWDGKLPEVLSSDMQLHLSDVLK